MRKWLALSTCLACLAAAIALYASRAREPGPPAAATPARAVPGTDAPGGLDPIPLAPFARGRGRVREADGPDAAAAPAVAPTAPASDAREPLFLVRIVDAESGEPLPGAELTLLPAAARPFVMNADDRGELEFTASEVPATVGERVGAVVRDDGGNIRLHCVVVVGPGIVLRVAPALVLRGEVALTSGRAPTGLTVSAWTPPTGLEGVQQFVAHRTLGPDGRFEITAGVENVPTAFTLRVGGVGVPASRRVPTADLVSATGARVVVGLAVLSVVVLEDDGAPVVQAHVRCAAPDAPDGDAALFAESASGTEGQAHFWVPSGTIGVVAGSPDHAPARAAVRVEAEDAQVVLRLRRLTPADALEGVVVFDDDTPVRGALVSVWSAGDQGELTVASMRQRRTDERGAFRIPAAVDSPLRVFGFHKEHGETEEVSWNPGDGPVRLVIDRGVTLRVVARGLARDGAASAREVDVVLVRDDGRTDSLDTDSFPVEFERLPPGRWRAFAIAARQRRWASGEIVIVRERPAELVLDFAPLDFVEGRVSPAPDPARRMSIAYAPPGWPAEAVQGLLTVDVGPEGRFRVAGPAPGEIELREGARTIERRPARGGTPLVFVLPE